MKSPTKELYDALEIAYTHFNTSLFGGELPKVIFTAQRQKSVMGYFSKDRWSSREGHNCHEIAINPAYVGRSALLELFQTLVHEMAHLWQHCFGKPSKRTYHNKEWAWKMESIGLMPSTTGLPGGNKTGEKMSDYPISGGRFIIACESLISKKRFEMPWVDRYARPGTIDYSNTEGFETLFMSMDQDISNLLTSTLDTVFTESEFENSGESVTGKVKEKYSCRGCGINVWGKPGLNLACNVCHTDLIAS